MLFLQAASREPIEEVLTQKEEGRTLEQPHILRVYMSAFLPRSMLPIICAMQSAAPPVRRTKPPIVPLSDHLYSYGVDKLRRQTTMNGIPAVKWLCWEHIKGVPCDCGGKRAHLFAGHCGKALSAELGAAAGCSKAACSMPHPEGGVVDALVEWHADVLQHRELLVPSPFPPLVLGRSAAHVLYTCLYTCLNGINVLKKESKLHLNAL